MLEKYTVRYYENLPTTKNPNKFILVGDVHGSNDPEFIQKITELALSKEKLIIFIGDIAGGDTLQKFLFLFYRTRITTQTTLIKENYFKLKEAEYALINEKYKKPDIKTIEQEMQEYYHYFHLGHYISNLPEDMKNVLKKEIKTNLDRFINIINEIKSQDPEKVIKIVSGNWDEETAFDYERNKEKLVLLPKDKRGLIVSKYLENHDIK